MASQVGNMEIIDVVQLLNHVRPFATPWTAARQASLSFTISQSSLKLMSIESVMPSNHLILCCPLLLSIFPALGSLLMSQLFASSGQSIGAPASASVLPMNIQGLFLLELTGLIPGLGRSSGRGNGNPLQYSCLGNPMERGAWWVTVYGITKGWT